MKIEELSYAINPGSHCDLFGAVMVAEQRLFPNYGLSSDSGW